MKKYYLIGKNTSNSLSPAIHSWIYKFCGIQATYSSKNIKSVEFESSLDNIYSNIKSNNIHGINITNPYKHLSLYRSFPPSLLISEDSMNIDAINCIYKVKDKIMGDNTDWYGFTKSLEINSINISEYNIIIIGAGGASRSIIYGLQKLGVNNFKVYNRSKRKININNIEYSVLDLEDLRLVNDSNLFIINCLPRGVIDYNIILLSQMINKMSIFYDLNYIESKTHTILKDKDIKVIDGLDMLIYQAIKSVELWSNQAIIDAVSINDIKKYLMESKLC